MRRETYIEKYLKTKIKKSKLGQYYRARIKLQHGMLFPADKSIDDLFPEVAKVIIDFEDNDCPNIGIHKDSTEFYGFKILGSYYLRYERFLRNNNIKHAVLNLFRSDWLEQCKDIDIIVVAYNSEPSRLHELQSKIYILESFHGKTCYPSSSDLWSYEDKIRLYYLMREYDVPCVNTFISHDYQESLQFIKTSRYPLVSKIRTGSGSRGVELVHNYFQAKSIIEKNFGLGRKALWTYHFEKDYVYFQDYIKDASYDLRIIIIGDVLLGYRRKMKGKDFRASGTGLLQDRSLIPIDAIEIAIYLKKKWNTTILAVDFVDTEHSQKHLVIEASISFGLDYPEYFELDGKRLYFQVTDSGLELKEGCFWIQDLIVKELINNYINNKKIKAGEAPICLKWKF